MSLDAELSLPVQVSVGEVLLTSSHSDKDCPYAVLIQQAAADEEDADEADKDQQQAEAKAYIAEKAAAEAQAVAEAIARAQ